ncbi:MAG: hypothetical protein GY714_02940 [Desulfobacterales bacterium]|nr:hypothetical protein [Desulfobacterales bacterium]MCP4163488.1 hypothetical protein [Deltaproteobacteria bacterium]
MRDFSLFKETEHMLQWLSDDPYEVICNEIEDMLQEQVSGTKLISIKVTKEPQWLTGGKKQDKDPDQIIMVRSGVAFEFDIIVSVPSGEKHEISGTYTWVAQNLDDSKNIQQRVWFDIGAELETHGSEGELSTRMYFEY